MKRFLIFITGMMLFLQHGKAQQDLEVSEILVSPQITACDLRNKDVYVVIRSVTSQSIDFGTTPTSLRLEIQGQSILYPLIHNMAGNSSDTVRITSGVNFTKGIDSLRAYLTTPIDGNSSNDTVIFVLDINPAISVRTPMISSGNFNCLFKETKYYQDVWVKNTGNMDVKDINVEFVIIVNNPVQPEQMYLMTLNGVIPAGDSALIQFHYKSPLDQFYIVGVTAFLSCDSALANGKTAIQECVDIEDLELVRFIKPQPEITDVKGEEKEIEMLIKNHGYNSHSNKVITVQIEKVDGNILDRFSEVIPNIDPFDTVYYPFKNKYTVPNEDTYILRVFIDNNDNYPYTDTVLAKYYAILMPETTISGKIMRQDSTLVSAGMVELYEQSLSQYPLKAITVGSDGTYSFTQVGQGSYLVKFIPDSLENAMPTYYGNTEFWYLADTITVADSLPIQGIDITIISINPLNGNSLIRGYVGEDSSRQKSLSQKSVSMPAEDVNVYLQREQSGNWTTLAQTLTNAEGYFEFRNIPAGRYKVILDVMGLVHDNPQIIVIKDGDTIQNIEYEITKNSIENKTGGVGIVSTTLNNLLRVYPNPTNGKLKIECGSSTTLTAQEHPLSEVEVEIYDIVGRKVLTSPNPSKRGESSLAFGEGRGEVVIDISHLASGLYFLKIRNKMVKVVKE